MLGGHQQLNQTAHVKHNLKPIQVFEQAGTQQNVFTLMVKNLNSSSQEVDIQ